jgi:GNAT superfamily N-acetyltransferase
MISGGERGSTYDGAFWSMVYPLYGAIWPRMPARLHDAAALGFPWPPTTHPFAWIEGGRALAHVGVLLHAVRLAGEDRVIAGVHAVCSHPDARGRGLARACMDAAVAWIDRHGHVAKLGTDLVGFYEKWGFRVIPNHHFVAEHAGGGHPRARLLTPTRVRADADLLRSALRRRVVVSDVFATRDEDGWLVAIDLALAGGLDTWAWHLPDLDAVLLAEHEGDTLVVHDVLAPELPPLDALLRAVGRPFRRVKWMFSPDLLDPSATPVPRPPDTGFFHVRGPWPTLPPFGFSTLWEH